MQGLPPSQGYDTGGLVDSPNQAPPQAAGVPAIWEQWCLNIANQRNCNPPAPNQPGLGQFVIPFQYPAPYFGTMLAPYCAPPMMNPQTLGGQNERMALPSGEVSEEPVYVNAKQYNGIMRRRESRAKAEAENKTLKSRKPYLHESRHLHALGRARSGGGRFLKKDKAKKDKK